MMFEWNKEQIADVKLFFILLGSIAFEMISKVKFSISDMELRTVLCVALSDHFSTAYTVKLIKEIIC